MAIRKLKNVKPVLVRVENLTKKFRPSIFSSSTFTAVNGISFAIHQGEVLGFLGPNGAGKTTTIQMLLGAMTPSSGSIYYFDKDFRQHRSEILQHVTYASGYARLPSRLTIEENLHIYGRLYGLSYEERCKRIKHLLTLFGLYKRRTDLTGPLSAGQMTRVILAKAFLPHPKIILLDEPTASLDPDVAYEVRRFIWQQQEEQNITVLFTSHNMAEVEELCDRVLILKAGNIIANSTPSEIASRMCKTRLQLFICEHATQARTFFKQHNYAFVENHNHFFEISIDDQHIASILQGLAKENIEYSQISIDKPRLEDYFMQIAKKD